LLPGAPAVKAFLFAALGGVAVIHSNHGAIVLRVVPDDFPQLLTQVEKQGNIAEHTTLSEDKTTQVVDTEACLRNLTAYRDSLRAMLSGPGLNIKDSVEIQEKLTDVQSDLDGETAKRKILASETEKVTVEIEFRVRDAGSRRSSFAPLWSALAEAGETLAESLGSVVTFVVFITPWILLFIVIWWFLRRLWHKRRARKAASQLRRRAPSYSEWLANPIFSNRSGWDFAAGRRMICR